MKHLADVNEKIAETVTAGYKKIENGVVNGFDKVTNKCVETLFAYTFGTVAALIMGTGMSLVMTDIAQHIGIDEPMIPGIVIGVAGMLMAIGTYPIYQGILSSRRKKYAKEIIALSDKIMGE